MVSKSDLIKILEKTRLFVNMNLSGDLEMEENELIFEYKSNPGISRKEFKKGCRELGSKLLKVGQMNHPEVIVEYSEKPDEYGLYKLVLKRMPLEGVGDNLTLRVIRCIYGEIHNSYLWKEEKK